MMAAHWKLGLAVAVAAAATLSLSACGSSNSSETKGNSSDTEQAALEFARCMRENGVPSFPDPVARPDGTFGLQRPAGVAPGELDAALESCQSEARRSVSTPARPRRTRTRRTSCSTCPVACARTASPSSPIRSPRAMCSVGCTASSRTSISSRHVWRGP
jgi:hypothetical protein